MKPDPLKRAQDFIERAWDVSGTRRLELARQALEISKDCADAYVLLAEATARNLDLEEARGLYEEGVKAGERALGEQPFKKGAGHFWERVETRPYMRARAGLAHCLWFLRRRKLAIEHYTDMLRLNPRDHQGIRYILAHCLLEEGSDEALGNLLERYKEDGATAWLYTRAIWIFRREGATPKANESLDEALRQNRFVPLYLLERKKIPNRLPEHAGLGDENEAIRYAAEGLEGWRKTEGALAWLSDYLLG